MRIWGFNVCIHSNGVVSGFGLVVAPNYGHGEIETETDEVQEVGERSNEIDSDTVRLIFGGQEVNQDDCRTLQLQDPEVDRIKSVTVYWDEVVVGMKIEVADRAGSFGRTTDAENSFKFDFDESSPLIGIYGYQSPQWMYGIGFYTIDAVSEQCKYVPPDPWVEVELPPEPEPIVEPEPQPIVEPEPEPIFEPEPEPVVEPEPKPKPELPPEPLIEPELTITEEVVIEEPVEEEEES